MPGDRQHPDAIGRDRGVAAGERGLAHLAEEDANLLDLGFGSMDNQLAGEGIGLDGRRRLVLVARLAEQPFDREDGKLRIDRL